MRNAGAAAALTLVSAWSLGCQGAPDPERAADLISDAGAQVVEGRLAVDWQSGPFVVLFAPQEGVVPEAPAEAALLDQFGVAFIPNVLVARVGQPVEFRNSEEIDHNVVAVAMSSGTTLFNVSTPPGDPYTHTFDEAGGYSIVCDIHPGMTAVLLVAAEPFAAVVEPDGTFHLSDVPAGSYRMTLWNADPELRRDRIVAVGVGLTELDLTSG